ncbi:dTMP kinase [Allofustis seminis]|uniref:dTMP kinase n=1 Tax=Allofustis seminis TaxID=166939 RepID=UPI000371D93C|nr:dTMP kinase [Allofustis seminis]
MKGLFISVEGPDGSGKSTVIKSLREKLSQAFNDSREIIVTREPGGSPLAEKIRHTLLTTENHSMDDRTEALLFAAGRRQHVMELIRPALARDAIILCDRFVDSSIAYQGAGRKIGMDEVRAINLFATEGLLPDITLFLDVDVERGLRRIAHVDSKRSLDRLELETIDFHRRVREGYFTLIKKDPKRFIMIDANQSIEKVLEESWNKLTHELTARHYMQ